MKIITTTLPIGSLLVVTPLDTTKKTRKFWTRRALSSLLLEGVIDYARIAYDLHPLEASVCSRDCLAAMI